MVKTNDILFKDICSKLSKNKQLAVVDDSNELVEISGVRNGSIVIDEGEYKGEYSISNSKIIKPIRRSMEDLVRNNPETGKRFIVELAELSCGYDNIETYEIQTEDCLIGIKFQSKHNDNDYVDFGIFYDVLGVEYTLYCYNDWHCSIEPIAMDLICGILDITDYLDKYYFDYRNLLSLGVAVDYYKYFPL